MIIYEEEKENMCPLDSIAANKTYNFVDDTQIIFITNMRKSHSYETNNCSWHFAAPYGYNFKLADQSFAIRNISIVNEKGDNAFQKKGRLYYIEGKTIIISYNKYGYYLGDFFGYLNVFKKEFNKQVINCNLTREGKTSIWSNFNTTSIHYPNNARCILNLTVPWQNQLFAHGYSKLDYGDNLSFFFDNKIYDAKYKDVFVFQANKNGYNSYVIWEFESDESGQSLGFRIIFEEIECSCAPSNITVPCFGWREYNIMNNNDSAYCGNLNCKFTVITNPECPTNFIRFNMVWSKMDIDGDCFTISSNNQVIISINKEKSDSSALLTSFNSYVFNFISNPSPTLSKKHFKYQLASYQAPEIFASVILSKESFTFGLEVGLMPINSFAIIKLDEKLIAEGDILEIFSNPHFIIPVTFYNDESFNKIIKLPEQCAENNGNPCELKNGKLIVYKNNENKDYEIVFFRAKKTHIQNCAFKRTVFTICRQPNYQHELFTPYGSPYLSMITKGGGDCQIAIILCSEIYQYYGYSFPITQLWTTSLKETVKIYAGHTSTPIIEFNQQTSEIWKDIYMFSSYYTISIPANSSIIIRFKAIENIYLTAKIFNFPYKTIWTSVLFGSNSTNVSNISLWNLPDFIDSAKVIPDRYRFCINDKISVNFTVLQFDISENSSLELISTRNNFINETYSVTSVGETFMFTNTNITVYYKDELTKISNVLIHIEAYKKAEERNSTIKLLDYHEN